MSRSYNFVSHVEFNHIEEISKLLKGHTELVAYLIHWGASLTKPDGNKMAPLACAQRSQVNAKPEDKHKWDETIKIIKDEAYRKQYIEALIPRINEMVRLKDIKDREDTRRQAIIVMVTVIVAFFVVHFLVIVKPPNYRRIISEKAENLINDLSLILKYLKRHYDLSQYEWANWGKAAAKGAAKKGFASKKLTGEL